MKAYYRNLGGFAPVDGHTWTSTHPSLNVGKHFKVIATGEVGTCIDACDERQEVRLRFEKEIDGWYIDNPVRVERGMVPIIEDYKLSALEEVM